MLLYVQRFDRGRFRCLNAGIGIIKMTMSVRILIAAMEKYVANRLLQPAGKVGDHALEGSDPHSKA